MDTFQLHVVIALGVTAVAAGFDMASAKIPNPLTFGGILAGFAFNTWAGFAIAGAGGAARSFGLSALGMFLSAFSPLVFFLRGEIGGGDVKLLAAIGAFVGPVFGFQVLAYTYAITLALLPLRILMKGRARTFVQSFKVSAANVFRARDERLPAVPFKLPAMIMGPSIFVGFALCTWINWRLL
jgi:Flp pilus assembly protein protease CpaA